MNRYSGIMDLQVGSRHIAGLKALSLTIGNFDGLHKGHRFILSQLKELSKKHGTETGVLTFNPHPIQVLYPEKQMRRLFDLKDQDEMLAGLGIDVLIREPFTLEFSKLSPELFLQECLIKGLSNIGYELRSLVVGHDFSFGAKRTGTIDFLREKCLERGIDLVVVDGVEWKGQRVSSSRIREVLLNGDVPTANELLERPYYMRGRVVKGQQRGRKLGIPTANLEISAESGTLFVPRLGVYFSKTWHQNRWRPGVTNIGINPTFRDSKGEGVQHQNQSQIKFETHILDFNEDLYEQFIKVNLLHWVRPEKKFESAEELLNQIHRDLAMGRTFFSV